MKKFSIRKDLELIQTLVEKDKKILDIGCGEGELIKKLEIDKYADTRGLEINGNLVRDALSNGLSIVQGDAEKDLDQYSDGSFDYVILSKTLQAMHNPKDILIELLRIGEKAIVSFPNFGYWKIRVQLLIKGEMPITENLPYSWYETPNIHFFTIRDFQELCKQLNIHIEKSIGLTTSGNQFEIKNKSLFANLLTNEAIFVLSKKIYKPIKIRDKKKIPATSRIAPA